MVDIMQASIDIVDNKIARIKQVLNSQHLLTYKETVDYIKAILNGTI